MTPRIPSEPISIRSGLGPAPEPGSRRLSQSPAGVIARTDSTRSSMWVSLVAKCPPARVAIQPPRVEYSNDCGKWRSVSPCSPSCSSSAGPNAPAWIRAAFDTASTSSTRSKAARSTETAPLYVSAIRGSTPATTLVPPPYGIAAAPASPHQPITSASSASSAGPRDEVGGVLDLPPHAADDVAVGLAERVRDAVVRIRGEDRRDHLRSAQARPRQLDRLERDRLLGRLAEPEALADPGRRRLEVGRRRLLVLIPPAPVLAATSYQ